ncbi:P-loop containing nucleoside triphosphate hydrolase protein [Lentinus tigrinus ALCF2SS1-7]|uniref:P-loop containing nucleoside triphosphate hydrolase protein n=1 Tax=Lentinus tigrinus ALCF2SS1-6 TaxID=1328759 RepID=A0A5C2SP87_9APHY|nr:P-loop containing nucleoside triphosphate hydrolase protein [Lentinus tigrinus ALCF2SS1-6]RPD79010.1 P-loop containing nucleoside triphosphate hydrolase protein [Lentinus tigrinus ALCF2SS1-7]
MPEDVSNSTPALPTIAEVQQKTLEKFGCRPCQWQCEVVLAQLEGKQDVVCISGTGSGKTLVFWMPLLFHPDGIQVVVTPLNVLGSQNKRKLEEVDIPAINVTSDTSTSSNIEEILAFKYRVVMVNPEIAFKPRGVFERIWKSAAFMSRVISIVWDKAHLIKGWSSFRPELGQASMLRELMCMPKHFLLASATMPEEVLSDVLKIAAMPRESIKFFHRSNDRPNIYLTVQKIRHPIASFKDLNFLILEGWIPGTYLPHFLIFFGSIEESIQAAMVLRQWLPPAFRERIVWFNADNTPTYRDKTTGEYKAHSLFGLCCTDVFGLGIDIPDVDHRYARLIFSCMPFD